MKVLLLSLSVVVRGLQTYLPFDRLDCGHIGWIPGTLGLPF